MCKAFDELMKEERRVGRREGKREGKKEGKREGKREERFLVIRRMIRRGYDEGQIRELTNCTKMEFAAAAGKEGNGKRGGF